MSRHEGLDRYVRRILKEKDLTLSDVERRAGGNISDSYVAGITAGTIRNLTIDKLKALARGLGVAESQILAVASGIPLQENWDLYESGFAGLFHKYKELSEEDKKEVDAILEMVYREIERRLTGDGLQQAASGD